MSALAIHALAGWAAVVLTAAVVRNRFFAVFSAVMLGASSLAAVGLQDDLSHGMLSVSGLLHYGLACAQLHFLSLCWARLRPLPWRVFVALPGFFFAAGTLFAVPWALVDAFGGDPVAVELAFVLAGIGLWHSLTTRRDRPSLLIDRLDLGPLRRQPYPTAAELPPSRPLRIVQITDPHLGPLMSVERLQRICTRAVEANPDLILVTGDFVTMESQRDPADLIAAFEPLRAAEGRTFACFGNHDHEAPDLVREVCAAVGMELLVDEARVIDTGAGPVQLVGADHIWRDRRVRLQRVADRCPRVPGALRIWLLHDPGAFRHLPDGDADLVLSGHTHGGQLGLVGMGLPLTVVSLFTDIPDHGPWSMGRNRLYVHRGTGVYGFPFRVGVPAEESVLSVFVRQAQSRELDQAEAA